MVKRKKGFRYDFNLLALLLIPIGVSLSVVGYQLSTILKLPIFIDMIGTMMVSMIAGPWVGAASGILGNLVNGMLNPVSIPFALVSLSVAITTGYFSRMKFYTNIFGTVLAAVVVDVISAAASAIVTVLLFGGVTGTGTDFITAAFLATGHQIWTSVMSTNLISGTVNIVVNLALALIIIHNIPARFLVKLNYGWNYVPKKLRKIEVDQ
jgi:energy-coupling factor transport system substrate-specific component